MLVLEVKEKDNFNPSTLNVKTCPHLSMLTNPQHDGGETPSMDNYDNSHHVVGNPSHGGQKGTLETLLYILKSFLFLNVELDIFTVLQNLRPLHVFHHVRGSF